MTAVRKTLVVQVAALGKDFLEACNGSLSVCGLSAYGLKPVFPAVTCTAQASLRTGMAAGGHGIVANGWMRPQESKVEFWNQSAHLLPPARIWDDFKKQGKRVGTLFMQQSLGDPSVDVILSPAPIHKHSGGIIQDCYSKPENLYGKLCKQLGRSFNLFHYWGPLSSIKATRWIADATATVMQDADLAPDLLFTYLPHLDYILQKRGPAGGEKLQKAFLELQGELEKLVAVAAETGYDVLLCSDYAITDAKRAVFPNIVLAENNLFRVRKVKGRTYPDLYSSPAIAVCDHQVAHIYLRDKSLLPQVLEIFEATPGVDSVLRNGVAEHDNAGDLILVSNPDCWFAYPWWNDRAEAPDYAGHVDIHNKIGFDPCELFLDSWIPPRTSQNTELIGGAHGRTDSPVFFATNLQFEEQPETFLEMVAALQKRLI